MSILGAFIQLTYVAMVAGGYLVFSSRAFAYIALGEQLLIVAIVSMTLTFFAAASCSDPGRVTSNNVAEWLRVYPPDQAIYRYTKTTCCRECAIRRVPRSRHCANCGMCVARFDHHCVWIDNCVGANNARFFLGFLASTALVCVYGAALCWRLRRELRDFGVALGIFCAIMSLALIGFSSFHGYLAAINSTSYECAKWSRYHESGARARALVVQLRERKLDKDDNEQIARVLVAADEYNECAENAYRRATILDNFREIVWPRIERQHEHDY